LYDQPLHFIHITGKADKEFVAAYYEESAFADHYEIYDYYENIYELFARSSLIVSRSGASTLAEILTVGLPAILIPYPYATENHQVKNAEVLKALGIAEIFEEKDLDCLRFVKTLKKMLSDDVLKVHVHEVAKKFKNDNFSENLYKLCHKKKY
jgi:UDP-N-acetylglucosamine--N-acetylmuramyl-(pentapeptide) pyrophosphoryl-undecaprenol N-acetylglucosamine transferase